MRRLDRASVAAPACLANYQPGQHNWDDVVACDRSQIRERLEQLQGRRCAYCEGGLDALGQHIEHFRRKHAGHSPHLTFDWTNLYWSCDQADSCGRHKDHGAGVYNVNDLIDPCIDDPDVFFQFRSDGTISIRRGLSLAERRKAEETLRVFNLHPNWGRLRNMRKATVANYVFMVDELSGFEQSELYSLFSEELAATRHLPFSTAIRHVLTEP